MGQDTPGVGCQISQQAEFGGSQVNFFTSTGNNVIGKVYGDWPGMEEMEASMKEEMPGCGVEEALEKLETDKKVLEETLSGVTGDDFENRLVSVPWGWEAKMEMMELQFLSHFFHHKMQLFMYLKLLGFPVNTTTLYFG